jgi:hypothetical protein
MYSITDNLFQLDTCGDFNEGDEEIAASDRQNSVRIQVWRRSAASTTDPEIASGYTQLILGQQSSPDDADQRLDRLSDNEFRNWLDDKAEQLRNCSLTEKDLP